MSTQSITVKGIDVDVWKDVRMKCQLENKTAAAVLNALLYENTETARAMRLEYFTKNKPKEEDLGGEKREHEDPFH